MTQSQKIRTKIEALQKVLKVVVGSLMSIVVSQEILGVHLDLLASFVVVLRRIDEL